MLRGGRARQRRRSVAIGVIVCGMTFFGSAFQDAPAQTSDGYLGQVTSAATTDPVIGVAGDISCPPAYSASATRCQQLATSDLLLGMNPVAVLTLGDNQYETGMLSEFQQVYSPTWGRLLDRTFPVPGNHEYDTPGASGYFSYFGARAGDPAKGYYSFDAGAWHVIALNSECSSVGGCQPGSPQETWLRADLAAHPAACTLAYWHKPRFSSGGRHPSSAAFQPLWQALYDAHADVVLSGHAHDYERFAPQAPDGAADDVRGIRQFVVGTGGRNLQILGALQPNSEVLQNTSFGVLKLVLHPTSYDWQFLPTPGGTFTDSGSRACGGQDIEPPTAPTGLTATATNSAQVDLAWGRSTDNVGVTGYRVYRDHAQVGTTGGSQTAYVDTTAAPATTYIYEVTAIDAAGRESPRSNAVTVTTPDAPAALTHVFAATDDAFVEQGAPNTNLGTSDRLIVDASPVDNLLLRFDVATANCDITSAKLRLTVGPSLGDGSPKGGAFSTTVTSAWSESTVTWANAPPANPTVVGSLATVSPGSTYEVNLSSVVTADGPVSLRAATTSSSAARYVSREGSVTLGPQLAVTCRGDVQPPTAPGHLNATAPSSNRVDLAWDASTDDVGVTGYRVYRNNVFVATTGGTQTSYADTGVAAATTYTYEVSASDAAGHESPRSAAVTVTTPTRPPLVFAPTDDSYVEQTAPSTNFGSAGSLVIDASPADNLLLRFDVATSGCHITGAKLRLTVGAGASDGTLKGGAFSTTVTSSWSESTVTWANAPAANAAVIASLGAVNPGQTYEVDVSSVVTADGPVSLRATTGSTGAGRYVSKEGSATLGPRLVVNCA